MERGVDAVGTFPPFYLAYRENDNTELLRRYGRLCARIMAAWLDRRSGPPAAARDHADVISVGVVSAHFRDHSVWNAVVKGWFQRLDRARFALHAFHLGTTSDQETLLARSRASRFEEGPRSMDQWVDTITAQRPDVLIYPEIGMDAMTVRLAAMRLAPVQIAPWGHPETTGLPTIDYFLSAEDMEAPGASVECGLPVVAWEGRFLRGRLASGIMKRIGLPELVARSEGEYVATAVRLCRDADFRARIAAGRHVLFGDEAPIRAREELLAAACRTPAQR